MNKRLTRVSVILIVLIAAMVLTAGTSFAKDKRVFKTLKKNKWTKTYDYCNNRYSKKQKGYIITCYKIKVPETRVYTFKMKNRKKKDDFYGVWVWSSKKRFLKGGDGGFHVTTLKIDEPIVLKKGTYYIDWFEGSKGRTQIKYTYKKVAAPGNLTKETAYSLTSGKKIYVSQTEKEHNPLWYKVQLTSARKIEFWTGRTVLCWKVYDSAGNEIEMDSEYMPDLCTFKPFRVYSLNTCQPGTYYIRLNEWGEGDFLLDAGEVLRSKVMYGCAMDLMWK